MKKKRYNYNTPLSQRPPPAQLIARLAGIRDVSVKRLAKDLGMTEEKVNYLFNYARESYQVRRIIPRIRRYWK